MTEKYGYRLPIDAVPAVYFHMALTVDDLRTVCTEAILERGKKYYEEGRVHILSRTGTGIAARVEGTSTYLVGVDLSSGLDAVCTCPYSREGYCKHIVAVLIAIIDGARKETGPDAGFQPGAQHEGDYSRGAEA